MSDNLRDRIAAALRNMTGDLTYEAMADAVIRELDLGIPCAANGCRIRRMARYHAEKSGEITNWGPE